MRKCRQCKNSIPWQVVIDGKTRHLTNRKFCLECSPFGQHNTRKDISSPPVGRAKMPWKDWPEKWRQNSIKRIRERGTERKQKLVDMLGGKCVVCGYNRCLKALAFHHKDESKKAFSLDTRVIQSKAWDKVLKEVKKCAILCHNCHTELHDGMFSLTC